MNTDPSKRQPNTLMYSKEWPANKQNIDVACYHVKKIQPSKDGFVDYYKGVLTWWRITKAMTEDDFKKFVEFEIRHPLVSSYRRQVWTCMLAVTNDEKYMLPTTNSLPVS